MKNPQIININPVDQGGDAYLSFIESDVIDDTSQLPIDSVSTITAALNLFDLTNGYTVSISGLAMTHQTAAGFWTIAIPDIAAQLFNRHKYVGTVSGDNNMRSFQILEFTVDNDGLEDVWMHLPYEIVIGVGSAKFIWYQAGHIGEAGFEVWMADAFQGGVGNTPATSAEKVTHRGEIIPFGV